MKKLHKKGSLPYVWAAVSLAGISTGAVMGLGEMSERNAEILQLREDTQAELHDYLNHVPQLLTDIEVRKSEIDAEIARMKSLLGSACVTRMMTPSLARSFDEAIATDPCTDISDEDLSEARPFYQNALSEKTKLASYILLLTDDPSVANDNVDTLRYYAGDMDLGEIQYVSEEVNLFEEEPVEIFPDSATYIAPSNDGFTAQTISKPYTESAPTPIRWALLGVLSSLSLAASIAYGNRYRIRYWIIVNGEKKQARNIEHEANNKAREAFEKDLASFDEIDEYELGRIASKLKKD